MPSVDRLTALLDQFHVRAHLFHTGVMCGVTRYAAEPGRGFLHVVRDGAMTVTHPGPDGRPRTVAVDRPSLLLYPRPLEHAFQHATDDGSDLVCATLDFDGGTAHPLVRSLPPVVVLPLDAVAPLRPTLDLLFAEVDEVRCGRRLLADRLFDVVVVQLFRWVLDHADELALPPGLLTGLADERLAPALVAVHEDPGAPWTVESLARRAAMSRSAFAAHFKDVVGTAPLDHVTGWRMGVAQDRLRAGAAVARVAVDLGYATPAAFSRAFSQRVGLSPRAWLGADRARRAADTDAVR
jgi:AraC-like DNA-binding protein